MGKGVSIIKSIKYRHAEAEWDGLRRQYLFRSAVGGMIFRRNISNNMLTHQNAAENRRVQE